MQLATPKYPYGEGRLGGSLGDSTDGLLLDLI